MARQVKDLLSQQVLETFVDREAERAILLRALEGDSPLVVHVHGIGGIGKSSLLDVFALEARAHGATVSKTVAESDVCLFAGITGDLAPNHIDEEYMWPSPSTYSNGCQTHRRPPLSATPYCRRLAFLVRSFAALTGVAGARVRRQGESG